MAKTKRKKRLIILAGVAVIFVVLLVIAIEFTSHSGFCASCHYMKPFFQSWEISSHAAFECSKCHYPPSGGIRSKLRKKIEGLVMVGRYWTKLYVKSKPWAEIRDENCLQSGCHDKRLLEGVVKFKKIVFDHKIHLTDLRRGKQLQCTSCHSQIVQGEHITVTESTCFICHFKESEHFPQIAACSHCHKKNILINEETSRYNHTLVFENGYSCDKCHSHTITGDGEVPKENCYKCHYERERLEKYDDTDLMHTEHISEDKIECNQCHLDIQHNIIKDIEAIADCRTCHTDFHMAQKNLYMGEGGKGIAHALPNVMLEKGLSCKGCHIFHEESGGQLIKSDTFISKAQACESCHGQGFSRILAEWETSTNKKLKEIKSIYERSWREVRESKHAKRENAESLIKDALFNIELVDKGKSVHNIAYSQELLASAYKLLQEALRAVESSYKPPGFAVVSEEIPTQCSNCHAGIEEINASIFGLNFPHKSHLLEQKISCDTCHSNARRHGEFIATKQSCATCHHKNPEKNCAQCHLLQNTLYRGGTLNGYDVPKDTMAEAEVECTDCHLNNQSEISRPDKNKCLDCHEEDYAEIQTDWQESVQNLIQTLTTHLEHKKKLPLTEQEKTVFRDIERTLQKIKLDGSSGVHNYIFVEDTLADLKNKIESIGKKR
ncbi:MAG: cytochrome c3 family protein [Candidatus Aminicenantes bacterium]|nr:cytochrome c3 family protein [Candidatus Aminicenantes bacterium]